MKDSSPSHSLVHAMLLEQYRLLLVRQMVLPMLYRVLLFVIAFFVNFTHLSIAQLASVSIITLLITFTWFYESRSVVNQAQKLADSLAEESEASAQDFSIKLEYRLKTSDLFRRFIAVEPIIWLSIIIIVLYVQPILH